MPLIILGVILIAAGAASIAGQDKHKTYDSDTTKEVNRMKPMKLTETDKKQLKENGYVESDFPQIERAMQKSKTTYKVVDIKTGDKKIISREKAIEILGRETWLSGISRSAFHWTATRDNMRGYFKPKSADYVVTQMPTQIVHFDSSNLFK